MNKLACHFHTANEWLSKWTDHTDQQQQVAQGYIENNQYTMQTTKFSTIWRQIGI